MLHFGWVQENVPGMSGAICDLQKGQKIQITKGFGFLPVGWTSTKVIFDVDGHSAFCTDGTLINCHDGFAGAIRPLACFVQDPQLTLKGRQKWNEIFGEDGEGDEEEWEE